MPVFCEAVGTSARPSRARLQCICCDCTEDRACAGGCHWVSLDPPVCSACTEVAADLGLDLSADLEAPAPLGESGLFGAERCPAATTPAPHAPLWIDETHGYCTRCRSGFST